MNNEIFFLRPKFFDLPIEQTQTRTRGTEETELIKSPLLGRSILTFLHFQVEDG